MTIFFYVQPENMQSIHDGGLGCLDEEDWLIGDAPEDDVIEQSDLLSQLHRRQRFKTLCLWTVRLNNTHRNVLRNKQKQQGGINI